MSKTKYTSIWEGPKTVGEFIELLSAFPPDWPVSVATPAGGGIAVEHREMRGKPVVAIFGKNGGRFGENPLTEEEYAGLGSRCTKLSGRMSEAALIARKNRAAWASRFLRAVGG